VLDDELEDGELINVLALYADMTGCGDYRVRFPAQAVNDDPTLNTSVRVADHLPADASFQGSRIHIRRIDVPAGVSVVSFQRPSKASLVGAMKWLKERRPDVGIVLEMDDDLFNLPAQHEAFGTLAARNSPEENVVWLRQAMRLADVLTFSTPELARRYGGSTPTFVVRNGVPESMLSHQARALGRGYDPERRIGWAGYTGTHPGDLEVTNGAVADVVTSQPNGRSVLFRNIGPIDGVAKALGLPPELEAKVEASGWLDPNLYRVALGGLDIGLVPLQDTAFNRAKSALKALEFAAAGVPVIASPLPEFRDLQQRGLPILLAGPRRRDWTAAINRLLNMSEDQLRQVANNHRKWVQQNGTVNCRAAEWAHAWRLAASIAHRRVRRAA
jgi:glycosyltransferase involved in cell wall biosynthesis